MVKMVRLTVEVGMTRCFDPLGEKPRDLRLRQTKGGEFRRIFDSAQLKSYAFSSLASIFRALADTNFTVA
jgi:hypothetical protein